MNPGKLKIGWLYVTIFITGAAVLVIEILGTRILAPFYGSTIFVWSSLITVTLGALALGYWLGGKLADEKHSFAGFYTVVVIAGIAVSTFLQYKIFIVLFADKFGLQYGPMAASILLFGVPLFLLGMVTPYAIRLLSVSIEASGQTAGRAFAFATTGSIAGALASGFFLIPIMTASSMFYLASVLLVAVGALGLMLSGGWLGLLNRRVLVVIIVLLILLGAGLFIKRSDFPQMTLSEHGVYGTAEVLFEKNTLAANYRLVGVPRLLDGHVCFLVDTTNQGCVNPRSRDPAVIDTFISTLQKELLPEEADILMLGAGLGMILYPGVPELFSYDILDLNPYTEEIFAIAGTELRPGRDTLIIEEARSYLIRTDKKYDMIWNDLFGNAAPVTHLITKEAHELVKARLEPDGIYLTHLRGQSNQSDPLISSMVSTLRSVFKNVLINKGYEPAHDDSIIFVASDAPLSKDRLNAVMAAALKRNRPLVSDFYTKNLTFIEPDLEGMIITDDHNPVEYFWAQFVGKYKTIADFRINFQHLTRNDFI